ncbi:unnamed protein product [Cochlearia groenlandica]
MAMHHILLTFLMFILSSFIAQAFLDNRTVQKVNGICKKTQDIKFCNDIFVNSLVTSSPSNKDLMNVTLKEAERFSANTCFFISTLLRNAGEERPCLQMCAEAYSIVNLAFANAITFFSEGHNGKISELQDKVSSAISICKTDFNVPDYSTNPMIKKNRDTTVFMTMVEIVNNLISSKI